MLKKDLTLYERGEDGELIPQKVKLEVMDKDLEEFPELKDQEIKIIPMTRGEIKKLFGDDVTEESRTKDTDGELILKNCKDPVYEKDEIPFIKPAIARSIVNTILRESGLKILVNKQPSSKENDEFGKNS